jgi:hypothetical protein
MQGYWVDGTEPEQSADGKYLGNWWNPSSRNVTQPLMFVADPRDRKFFGAYDFSVYFPSTKVWVGAVQAGGPYLVTKNDPADPGPPQAVNTQKKAKMPGKVYYAIILPK